MNEIKNLEINSNTTTKLYDKVKEIVDSSTGEVTTIVSSFLRREKTKDDFIKLFAENIDYLNENLSSPALRVIIMMMKNLNYQNVFRYDSEFVNYFVRKDILSKSSVYRALKELEDKRIIFKLSEEQREEFDIIGTNSFIVNPQVIGKGSFKDIRRLRQTVTKTFDFDKLEMKQEIQVESAYEGFEDVIDNPDKFQIDEIKQVEKDKNIERRIVVSKKELHDTNQEPNLFNTPTFIKHKKPAMGLLKFSGILNGAISPDITAKDIRAKRAKEKFGANE
ncbi:hypothetical protein [uncultured Campylobacter sp.]|uniref:hypothetical protein n=1 Tax=uncultured Campylobacter sp. TaxID=218934 RepID=UPI0026317544|nr:hypothetical protein [uncultured Campylobacter sp.]